jgi:hypothetical protein
LIIDGKPVGFFSVKGGTHSAIKLIGDDLFV